MVEVQSLHKGRAHILILIATDVVGGPGKGIFQIVRHADPQRFSFDLCNFEPKWCEQESSEFYERAQSNGIYTHRLRQDQVIDLGLLGQLYRLIRKEKINLLQTHSYKANIMGCILKLRYRIPWIGFAHGYTSGTFRLHLYNRLDQLCYRFADRIVTVSAPLQSLLLRRGVPAERIRFIPNAIDPEELQPRCEAVAMRAELKLPATSRCVIGVIGRLSSEKGHQVFLQAFRLLVPHFPDLRALIVGKGPLEKQLRVHAVELGIEEKIIFTGHRSDMPDIYRMLDLVVIPSFSEGHPNVLLEAMACGIPVVSTDVGGVRDSIGKAGLLVQPGRPEELAAAMATVLNDPSRARELATADQSEVLARFDPQQRAQRIQALYDEVLGLH